VTPHYAPPETLGFAECPSDATLAFKRDPDFLSKLSPIERMVLPYHADFWLRPDQRVPKHAWRYLGFLCGRGWGKSWTIATEINRRVRAGEARNIALVGPTEPRAHEVMVKFLIATSPPWFKAYEEKGGVSWPNGAHAYVYTAESPEVRGPNFDHAWLTEVAFWPANTGKACFDNVTTATREGRMQIFWDTTSKGKNALVLELLAANEKDPVTCPIIRGSMFDNEWLPIHYLRAELVKYPPGRRREEEIEGKVYTEAGGALWQDVWFNRSRVPMLPPTKRTARLIALDPNLTVGKESDECGFAVGDLIGSDIYLTHDLSAKLSPEAWGDLIVDHCERGAAGVIYEVNRGGDLLIANIRARAERRTSPEFPNGWQVREWPLSNDKPFPEFTRGIIYARGVKTQDSKETRAYGPASLTEQGRVHLCGHFAELEAECTTWVPGETRSPNRLDAFVYLVLELSGLMREKPVQTPAQVSASAATAHAALQAELRKRMRGARIGL
jgi:phage terminase large subunit-like protein